MNKFHTLQVKKVSKVTSDSVSITFEIPQSLEESFKFSAGQYITLRKEINGENIQRAYSIWKAPYENEVAVLVKKVENGKFSSFANDALSNGDFLEVMAPQGNFVPILSANDTKHYTLVAAGSGITPVFSILKEIVKIEPNSTIDLFYSNKTEESSIFHAEIMEFKSDKVKVHNFYSRQDTDDVVFNGRITESKINEIIQSGLCKLSTDEFYICGPEEMILGIKSSLVSQNVSESKINVELVTASADPGAEPIETDFSEAKITLTIDDDDFEYTYNMDKADSILEEGINQGLDLPYSCKGGVCCTCKAKITEGSATMKINYALTDGEVEEGYVLTCQAIPTSSKVSVNYDE